MSMTKTERAELARLLRLRARVAKADIDAQGAKRLAEFEQAISARFDPLDRAWADLTTRANEIVREADRELAERADRLGIQPEFRPRLYCAFGPGGGAMLTRDRKVELRRAASTTIDARAKAAKVEIDRTEAALQTKLAASAIESEQAAAFLAEMPAIDGLMPSLSFEEIDAKVPGKLRLAS
jgi:hypothetical protein